MSDYVEREREAADPVAVLSSSLEGLDEADAELAQARAELDREREGGDSGEATSG